MNVLTFKESLIESLQRVPGDIELVLGAGIMIPLIRNGAEIGKIEIRETETTVVFHKDQKLRAGS